MSSQHTPPSSSAQDRLLGYSLLAGALLGAMPVRAAIVYTDVDPDLTLFDAFFPIDFNGDGVTDITIRHRAYTFGGGSYSTNYRYAEVQLPAGNRAQFPGGFFAELSALPSGAAIGPTALFTGYGRMAARYAYVYGGSSYVYADGPWLGVTDRYLGVEFAIGGNTHYGWIRMDVPSDLGNIVIKDFAYEDVPNTTILAGDAAPPAGEASNLAALDVADNGNGLDLELSFQKADDESTVSAYRLFAVKSGSPFTVDMAASLPPARYVETAPTGSDQTRIFGATAQDADGDPIGPGQPYRCYVLSMPDGTLADAPSLSDPSNEVTLLANAGTASDLTATDVGNTGTGADLAVSFRRATDESTVSEYRIVVVDSAAAPGFDLSAANAVPPGNYTTVAPTGIDQSVLLPGAANTAAGVPLGNDVPYVVFVLSVADGTVAQSNALSPSTASITLRVTSGLDPASGEGAPRAWYDGTGIALDADGSGTWRLHGLDGRLLDEGTYAPGTARLPWPSPERALLLSGVQDGRPWTRRVAR